MKPTKASINKLLKEYYQDDIGYDYIPLEKVDEIEELILSKFSECGVNREEFAKGEKMIISRVNSRSIRKVMEIYCIKKD